MGLNIGKGLGSKLARFVPSRHLGRASSKLLRPDELSIGNDFNSDWAQTARGSRLSFVRAPVISRADKVFTMGSCFAREISYALGRLGFDVYPQYKLIEYDETTQKPYKLRQRNHMNHYNTFCIRYEFEHALNETHFGPDDFVCLPEQLRHSEARAWQDPYRRQTYAASKDAIVDLSRKIDDCIRHGIFQADVFVLTLGLTEVWRNDASGLYLNQVPHGAESGRNVPGFTFVQSSYEQNYENVRWVCSHIAERFPEKKIILTVSPVALSRTFSGSDIVVANMESKSILRAVAGAISREFDNVVYWPSYEIARTRDVYEDDGRHVTPEAVKLIIDKFMAVHLSV